jgi:hypothetical protein
MTESGPGADTSVNLKVAGGTGTMNLAPGFYLFTVRLDKSGSYAGKTGAVHIYTGMTTGADYTFSSSDFQTFISLTNKVWVNGVTADGETDSYKFHAEAGKRYVITWQNGWYYNSSYGEYFNGVNYVSAAWADGTSLFSNSYNGYYYTQSFVAASAGDVIITSVPYPGMSSYGSYKIAFAEVETLDEDTWSGKTLPAGGFAYYQTALPASSARTLQWKDKNNGLDSSAADILVSAFRGGASNVSFSSFFTGVDSGYDIPQPFSDYNESVVLIRAEAKTAADTGNYALRYAEPEATARCGTLPRTRPNSTR